MNKKADHVEEAMWRKLFVLSGSLWESRAKRPVIEEWLNNFDSQYEREHAMHLLSQLMYFGLKEVRALLRELFDELFQYRLIRQFRRANGNPTDPAQIRAFFDGELAHTRFFGVGNPSESGTHLLYYLRQETDLPKTSFLNTHEIFTQQASTTRVLRNVDVRHYVFVDDLCGSGSQASDYSKSLIVELKHLNPNAITYYLMLFGTTEGIATVRSSTAFDVVEAVVELDNSYKVFEGDRYFLNAPPSLSKADSKSICLKYGTKLLPPYPLGYKDGQLLLALHHNTPDNSLPVIWSTGTTSTRWTPIFRRYDKKY